MSGAHEKWLVIPVEVQVREWLGRLLVGAIAADRGYNVLIGHDRVVRRLARYLPRGVLFDKSLGTSGDRKVARYHRLGYDIAALDEEMTGIYANPDYFFGIRLAQDTLDKAHRWFTISSTAHDMAVQRYPGSAGKFTVTGLPRTDVWREPFHPLYEEERSAIAARHGRFILFCSNFGRILHTRRDDLVQKQSRDQEAKWKGARAYQQNLEGQLQANLDAYLEMLPKLRQWFPEHKLLVRPHPSEDINLWRAALSGVEGLDIVSGRTATPWILASDVLVHHGCTTGVEAELLGKPQIMYAPHPDDHHDTQMMREMSTIVKTEDALRAAISTVLKGDRLRDKDVAATERWFAAAQGDLAAERIVSQFDQFARPSAGLPGWIGLMRYSPRHLWAQYKPRAEKARAYSLQKWPHMNIQTARNGLRLLAAGAKLGSALEIEEVFPQLFQIRRKT